MVRFAFALVGAVQPAPGHTISEYVLGGSMSGVLAVNPWLSNAKTVVDIAVSAVTAVTAVATVEFPS